MRRPCHAGRNQNPRTRAPDPTSLSRAGLIGPGSPHSRRAAVESWPTWATGIRRARFVQHSAGAWPRPSQNRFGDPRCRWRRAPPSQPSPRPLPGARVANVSAAVRPPSRQRQGRISARRHPQRAEQGIAADQAGEAPSWRLNSGVRHKGSRGRDRGDPRLNPHGRGPQAQDRFDPKPHGRGPQAQDRRDPKPEARSPTVEGRRPKTVATRSPKPEALLKARYCRPPRPLRRAPAPASPGSPTRSPLASRGSRPPAAFPGVAPPGAGLRRAR